MGIALGWGIAFLAQEGLGLRRAQMLLRRRLRAGLGLAEDVGSEASSFSVAGVFLRRLEAEAGGYLQARGPNRSIYRLFCKWAKIA